MRTTTVELDTHERSWSPALGRVARAAARATLRADENRDHDRSSSGALDAMVREYLDHPELRGWVATLPSDTDRSAGRALLTRRFFRVAASEPGHHVIDHMVTALRRFDVPVASTIGVPAEQLDEILWADVAAWMLQSLARFRTAYIPSAAPSDPSETSDILDVDPLTHEERLAALCGRPTVESHRLLDRFYHTLEQRFGRIPPDAGVRRQADVSTQPCRSIHPRQPTGSPLRQGREFQWDAKTCSFAQLVRVEILGQVRGAKRFLPNGFMYSVASRALRTFAGARIVDRLIFTVCCSDARDPHAEAPAPGDTRVSCRHPRHTLRHPYQPVACDCAGCAAATPISRVARWLTVTTPEFGYQARLLVCGTRMCRRVAPGLSAACQPLTTIDVWIPTAPVYLDSCVFDDEGDRRGVIDTIAADEPSAVDRIIATEGIRARRDVAIRVAAGIRSNAAWVCALIRTVFERELDELDQRDRDDIARARPRSWTRLAVLASLVPDFGSRWPAAWEVRLLLNVRHFTGRAAAIEQLPGRLCSGGVDVPAGWASQPLTESNFGKIKSEMARRWQRWLECEPLFEARLTALVESDSSETVEDIDELFEGDDDGKPV